MRNALIAIALLVAAPITADAKPRKAQPAEVTNANAAARKAKDELKQAKSAAKLAAHRVRLAKARAAATKANQRLNREQWIADCITERTGPTGGISQNDAVDICVAEAPDLATFTGEQAE